MTRTIGLCLVLAFATLIVPPLLVPVPPLLDYPNHLARWHVLVDAVIHGRENPFYAVAWAQAWLNSAVDALAVGLGALMGADWAGTVILCLAIILPPLGAATLNRAVFGGWHWWQIGFPVLAWNGSLVMGLVTFQIGIGLAFLMAAFSHARLRRRSPAIRVLAWSVASSLLLLVHPFAAAFHAALLGGLLTGRDWLWRRRGASLLPRLRAVLAGAFACALPVVLYLLLTPVPPGASLPPGVDAPQEASIGGGLGILAAMMPLFAGFLTYRVDTDLVSVLVVGLIACVGVGNARRHAGLLSVAAVIAALSVFAPVYFLGNGATNWRIGSTVALALVVAWRPEPTPARRAALVPLASLALIATATLRTGWITGVWLNSMADVQAVQRALSHVEPGARVLPAEAAMPAQTVSSDPEPHRTLGGIQPLFWHLPVLAVHQRGAFVPTFFAAPGKQPIRVRSPWDRLAVHEALPVRMRTLSMPIEVLQRRIAEDPGFHFIRFIKNWRNDFDYIFVLNSQRNDRSEVVPDVPHAVLVADEGFVQLWRIERER